MKWKKQVSCCESGQFALLSPSDRVLSVTTDFERPLSTQFEKCGFDWIDSNVTSDHYPACLVGIRQSEIALIAPERLISDQDLQELLIRRKLHAADLRDLLAIAAEHPDEHCGAPILATAFRMQSCQKGNFYVPYITTRTSDQKRILSLRLSGAGLDYGRGCRFAVVLWRRDCP